MRVHTAIYNSGQNLISILVCKQCGSIRGLKMLAVNFKCLLSVAIVDGEINASDISMLPLHHK